ncbi:glycoside hydrolase family 2 [Saccharopolyspora sp. HNM0986]|uniref:glycoside hydrolase family 2 protein n=1 Tax=Saccharopolyspora galaxeae TaxID=2781241 RepID=UPI00190DFB74|nr:sugar-binding domain-containing protein [Saccharopolyspora sp. HNM0986]MBK0866699.1 glycoside hydrolase family 2 [Saccharopolyspora sp. HNM0986]
MPAQASPAPQWEPQEPPLTTPWTDQVGPDNALPEYPRPQMTREQWLNLNGLWEFAGAATPPAETSEQILVPYPPESGLSGIQRHDDHLLYKRTFEVPPDWAGQRLLLHFGAVDQKAAVSVNGKEVAVHEGGSTAFSADITDAVTDSGPQEVTVEVEDRNDANPYPVGKQRNDPGGIFYTGASGIWQTVWLEPVPDSHITGLKITPDLPDGSFAVRADGSRGGRVEAVLSEPGGGEVARASGDAGADVRLPVPDPHLWSPDDPYLYDLKVRLLDDEGRPVDEVGSYAGMRSIGLVDDEQGRPRLALNGKILFQHGPLDQGYWPDGIFTAPTDEALRSDLEQTKQLGFNMVRKHIKVEPARWYAHADRLGLLVWQDMPALVNGQTPGEDAKRNYEAEIRDMIDQLGNSPSIVTWVPFNEGWGEFDTARIAEQVQEQDPTRLVDAASGVNCCDSLPDTGAGHIYDDHTYVGPGAPEVTGERASVDGEYGGLGLVEEGHLWPGEPSSYEIVENREELTRRYREVHDDLVRIIGEKGISASVYTQITDVENEVNGFFTYDRKILKPDADAVREANRAVIDAGTP